MIRHILLLQPHPESTPQAVAACRDALKSLVGRIPGLLDCRWGENLAPVERQGGFTHGFTMDFVDQQSVDAYGPHPAHQPVAAQVRAAFDRIVVFDFEIRATSPRVKRRRRLHRRRRYGT